MLLFIFKKSAEAQCLANEIQLYYGKEDPKKTALLETFTNKPDTFNYNDLVEEVNSISLSWLINSAHLLLYNKIVQLRYLVYTLSMCSKD